MDATSATQSAATAQSRFGAPAATDTARSVVSSDFETFLKMLTAQIQNQDPLNPTPSDEFAVQLATFSSVEQQVRTNELLEGLGAQFGAAGMTQFAGWVGMEARAPVPVRFDGSPVTLSPAIAAGADRAELVVRDATGREVERLPMAATPGDVVWAGTDANGTPYLPGTYSFELVSFGQGTPLESTTPLAYGRITEARMDGGQAMLVFDSGAVIGADEVSALRQPAAG